MVNTRPESPLRWRDEAASRLSQDAALSATWDRLNAQRKNLPFQSARQMATALSIFGTGGERLLCAERDGQAVAMFLLVSQGRGRWISFQPSQQPLGAWVSDGSVDLPTLASSLQGTLPLCLALSITQIDPWLEPRPADGAVQTCSDYVDTGWVDIAGDFDPYWAERGKNLRQNMRKQRNRLATDGTAVTLHEWRAPADMAGCVERYGQLESSGWKAGIGTAIHPDNAQGRYYREILEQAAAAGEAVVYEYRFDAKPVAMNLCLQRDGLMVILKTTYDESIKHCSPAFMLLEDELRAIFPQATVQRVEFYGKFMEWHSRWTENKRMLYHFTRWRWSWLLRLVTLRRALQSSPAAADAPTASGTD